MTLLTGQRELAFGMQSALLSGVEVNQRTEDHRKPLPFKSLTEILPPRDQDVVRLLMQGCDNEEIARQIKMARRTVKAHLNRMFLRFEITSGIRRVKLAVLLYRSDRAKELAERTLRETGKILQSPYLVYEGSEAGFDGRHGRGLQRDEGSQAGATPALERAEHEDSDGLPTPLPRHQPRGKLSL